MSDQLSSLEQLNDELRQNLNRECAQIKWRELERFFAAGGTIEVAKGLDLIDVALCIHADDSQQVKQWMDSGALCPVSDDSAIKWLENDQLVWALVIKPWVLVQVRDT